MVIYLDLTSPPNSSDLPENIGGQPIFCSVLLRMGFTWTLPVTRQAVVSYTAFPPLPNAALAAFQRKNILCILHGISLAKRAVYFCCTFLRVTSTRRYLASCPVKPGLSSPAAFRQSQPRPSVLLA